MDRDYSSIYTTKDFFQKVMPLYFNKDELSLSTIGALGMFIDINTTITEDMINIAARYINEQMPGQAELPDFIYANAANYGISSVFGTPAKMSMLIMVKEADVLNNAKNVSGHKEFVLDSDMSILVDDLYFSIPYDIKIRSTEFNGDYNHMAFYDISYTNEVVSENVPFIKIMKTVVSGDIWLVLRVNVYQYIRRKYTEPITTNNKLNIPFIDLEFSNQLCNFEAFYTPAGSTTMTQLEKRAEKEIAVTTPFIYYRLTGDNSIRFSFANDDRYFLPDYNSTVTIYLYETNGSDGNFPLNKNGIDVTIKADTENEDISYNRNIFPQGLSQGNSTGGNDQLSLEKVKLLTAEKQVTVNSYTTDNDLNMYFNNFAAIYEHNAIFVKQRDDYAGREYGCFTRISDGNDIFPTNTLNIRLSPDDIDESHPSLRQYIVKPGAIFQYESSSNNDIVTRVYGDTNANDISYVLAPLMVITSKPNKVNYYMNSVDKDIEMNYTYFNLDSLFNFVVSSCNISRDAIHGENKYNIELNLTRVDGVFNESQTDEFSLSSSNGDIDISKMEVLIIFDTSVGNYVRMTYSGTEIGENDTDYAYKFTASIGTTDMIDDGRILLTDLLTREGNETDERLIDMTDPGISFAVFYNYDNIDSTHDYEDISLVENHMLCNIYTPNEGEFYFAYPLDLIRSHVIFEDLPTSTGFGFYVKQVPLFGKDFILNGNNMSTVLDDITYEHDFLSTVVESLHGLFTINMKFYNTYGRSRSFYIGYGTNHEIINQVNCKISMGIKFYDGIIIEDYLLPIKTFIKSFFEDLNKLASGTNQAYVSVLEQKLHNNFSDQIRYTIFYSINDYDSKYQVIETVEDMEESSLVDFVPEYLTLSISDIQIITL